MIGIYKNSKSTKQPIHILPVIVIAQFLCTSLWFAGNGVMNDLARTFNLHDSALAHLTSAVQFGFIMGTLVFAGLTLVDRFSPSKVFLLSALLGSLFNIVVIWDGHSIWSILCLRFMAGFFLAGIYPVGMKIAADYYEKGLGKSLGFLVGALVLGTALPHGLKEMTADLPWKMVIKSISILAIIGGGMLFLLVPDGPYRKAGQKTSCHSIYRVFSNRKFRTAAFGYFGHMWELYAFWTFVPIMLQSYNKLYPSANINVALFSFLIIGIGGLACVMSGYISQVVGVRKTAFIALSLSCFCCLLSPFIFMIDLKIIFVAFLFFWGMVVIADSPLFSTLVANNATPELKGTALTLVSSIGFFITIVSIQLISRIMFFSGSNYIYLLLSIGPILGLITLWKNRS